MRKMASRLKTLAYYDSTTQLPNLSHFQRLVNNCVSSAQKNKSSFSLFYLDVGGYFSINEYHGHSAGSQVLTAVANRLRTVAHPRNYLVSKTGISEFAVIVRGQLTDQHLYRFSQALLNHVDEAVAHNELNFKPVISVGVARYSDHVMTSEDVVANASSIREKLRESKPC